MSYTYLQERGEESSAECFSDIPASVLSRSKNIPERSCCNDSETGSCRDSQYGTTSAPSTENRGEEKSTSSQAVFPARTSAQQEREQESKEQDQVCGEKWLELLVKYDRDTCSWKTHLCLWEEDLPWSSVTLPKWGMMRDGVCWEQTTQELPISESESGSRQNVATPTATANQVAPSMMKHPSCREMWRSPAAQEPGISIERLETKTGEPAGSMCRHYDKETGRMAQIGLSQQVKAKARGEAAQERGGSPLDTISNVLAHGGTQTPQVYLTPQANEDAAETPAGKMQKMLGNSEAVRGKTPEEWKGETLNPSWVEWLMGWPIGWTDLKPLETDKFRMWPQSPGKF